MYKLITFLILILLLSGCSGLSALDQAATMVAQTVVAASTLTPTLTSTPTETPTPTFTPTPNVTSTPTAVPIVIIDHAAPKGKAPTGFPGGEISKYLKTTGGGFTAQVPESGGPWTVSYVILLDVLLDLPAEAYIVTHFENPLDPSSAIVVAQPGPPPKQLYLESPSLTGVKCKNYWVEIHIYDSPAKETELGRHVQWINSNFDLDKVQSVQDLSDGRTCSP